MDDTQWGHAPWLGTCWLLRTRGDGGDMRILEFEMNPWFQSLVWIRCTDKVLRAWNIWRRVFHMYSGRESDMESDHKLEDRDFWRKRLREKNVQIYTKAEFTHWLFERGAHCVDRDATYCNGILNVMEGVFDRFTHLVYVQCRNQSV